MFGRTVIFEGNNIIDSNQGAFLLEYSVVIFRRNVMVSNNHERHGYAGSAIFSIGSNLSFTGYTMFSNNSVSSGGVIDLQHMIQFSFSGNLKFINNNGQMGKI